MAGEGFHVDPPTLIIGSAGFADVQSFWDTQYQGLLGSIPDMAGMAGDDDAGHAFAGKYQPAAQSVVDASGRLYAQLGGVANGLFMMAQNYLKAEGDNTVGATNPIPLPDTRQPQCDTSTRTAQVPNVIGHTQGAVEDILAKFWPQGNPDALRRAADDWHTLAGRLQTVGQQGDRICGQILAGNSSSAVDGFASTWGQLHGGNFGGKEPLVDAMADACAKLEAACRAYADRIDKQREALRDLAIGAGVVAGVGLALTLVTFGVSDAAAGAGEAAIAADAAALVVEFTEATASAGEVAVLAEAEAIVAEAAASLSEIAPAVAGTSAVGGISLAAAGVAGIVGLGLTTLAGQAQATPTTPGGRGPIPRDSLSPFPPLNPAESAGVDAWKQRMVAAGRFLPAPPPSGASNSNQAAARAYQIRVAGDTEYTLYTTVHDPQGRERPMNADGVRADDGAAIEAKHVQQKQGCGSLYRLNNSDGVYHTPYENAVQQVQDQMERYTSAFADPRNKVNHLEVITNDDKAAAYFEALRRAENTPGETRVVP